MVATMWEEIRAAMGANFLIVIPINAGIMRFLAIMSQTLVAAFGENSSGQDYERE